MKKLRQRITLNNVSQAINSLKEQNLNPTADSILAEVIRQSNGTVGGSKGTVLKLKRQLEGTGNCTGISTVKDTSVVKYSTNKRTDSTKSVPINLDDKLLSTLEVQLWAKLEARLDDKLREQLEVHQVSGLPHNRVNELEEALQEMCELWLDSITQYTAAKTNLTESEAQAAELHQVNERLVLENNELKSKLEAIQHERQAQNEAATNQVIQFQSTLNQAANQIEIQQTQLNQLNQDLHELHELWLKAVLFQTATPSASASTITETDPLESYFQVLTQLHRVTPAQKYDYAMKLFERGMGPSEVSRILAVNKGSLQHYKDGKRNRPEEG